METQRQREEGEVEKGKEREKNRETARAAQRQTEVEHGQKTALHPATMTTEASACQAPRTLAPPIRGL